MPASAAASGRRLSLRSARICPSAISVGAQSHIGIWYLEQQAHYSVSDQPRSHCLTEPDAVDQDDIPEIRAKTPQTTTTPDVIRGESFDSSIPSHRDSTSSSVMGDGKDMQQHGVVTTRTQLNAACHVFVSLVLAAAFIALAVLAALNYFACPCNASLPQWALVTAVGHLVYITLHVTTTVISSLHKVNQADVDKLWMSMCGIHCLGMAFRLATQISGCLIVWSMSPQLTEPSLADYCSPLLYHVCRVYLCVDVGLTGLLLLVLLCCGCAACCMSAFQLYSIID